MATNWNSSIQFPQDSSFINRIKSLKFEQSKSSGNPMLVLTAEVIHPKSVMMPIDGTDEEVNIAGVETIGYFTTKTIGKGGVVDEQKSANNLKNCKKLLLTLFPENPEYSEQFIPENPDPAVLKAAEGLCVYTMMAPQRKEKRKNPTSTQIEEAKTKGIPIQEAGDVMTHPITKKPIIAYWPQVKEIFGLAPKDAAANVPY